MAIKARGEVIDVTEQVDLTIQLRKADGTPVNATSVPKISIVQPNGAMLLAPTSVGVSQVAVGKYSYIFTVPINGPYGIYNDVWSTYVDGYPIQQQFEFAVLGTQVPAINTDGYTHLGDDVGFDYSQAAIHNINKLLKSLKARLNSSGKAKSTDSYGNVTYVNCDIFSVDMLVTFLSTALWEFNQVPFFTSFTFDDDYFINQFGEVLVEYATLQALASKALIERGREFALTDNGVNFNPPTVSDIMMTQYSTLLTNYWDKLKMIKASLRPHPKGLGTFSMSSGNLNPAVRRLRHVRERRII
jgi:hypothetical protein